jgi:hypothetical protein
MSTAVLILGESGTGKSTALRNLDPVKTLLIQAIKKPLPFKAKGWKVRVSLKSEGNVIQTDDAALIEKVLRQSPHEVVVIDDFQYVMANEYMRRTGEKGYDKFTDIGKNAWNVLTAATDLAQNRRVYILSHTTTDEFGRTKIKTIGKMLDEKITLEGMVTIVLRTQVRDGRYFFATQNNGSDTTKSPMSMFSEMFIDSDLAAVDAAICDYYEITPLPQAA